MIDIKRETLISLREARKEFPTRPSLPTLWRWIVTGVRGVVLDSVRIGGRRFTSKEGIQRFLEASSGQTATEKKRNRKYKKGKALDNARDVLDQFGV